jgi:hypothetical protein
MGYFTEIRPPVVTLVTVDVVDCDGLSPSHNYEYDDVREKSPIVNMYSRITSAVVVVHNDRAGVHVTRVPVHFRNSCENPIARVILEETVELVPSNHSTYSAM